MCENVCLQPIVTLKVVLSESKNAGKGLARGDSAVQTVRYFHEKGGSLFPSGQLKMKRLVRSGDPP